MNDITITTEGTSLYLTAPYNPAANTSYKQAGGRWDGSRKAWRFADRDIELVRAALMQHFGYADQVGETVDARVRVADWEQGHREGTARFAGRVIARRRSRDADVELGRDCVLVEGEFAGSGGSMRYPDIEAADTVIVEVRGVPAGHVDLKADNVEIVTEAAPDIDALMAERETLLARLAEIDAQLPEPEGTEMTTRDAAVALGVSVRTVQRWAATGKVNASKDDAGRWVITITV